MQEQELVRGLTDLIGAEGVRAGSSISRAYDCDAYTVDRSKPTAVVLPSSTQQVQKVIRFCLRHALPYTPRGAGTGLSGGAMPALGGVVISTKRLTRILEIDIDNRRLKAESGVVNTHITQAVAAHGLHFAPDPSSQTVSTLGGNIAENSGGPHTLKYGVTAPHILGLTYVDTEGEVVELGSVTDGFPGPDPMALIIGGEGLLGVVTEAWVRLTPVPKAVETALAAFPTIRNATQAVAGILAAGVVPAALEMMDKNILGALNAAFGLTYPEGTAALLLVECDGEPGAPAREMAEVQAICQSEQCLSFVTAQNEDERKQLWTARKKGIGAMGRLAPSIVTHDGVIPPSKLPEMLEFVYEVAAEAGVGIANLFHAGDGNLHPCFYFDDRDPKQVEAVVHAGERIIRRCVELGGSVTGEHGVGIEKQDLLQLMFSPDDLAVQMRMKEALAPGTLCNPCKVIPNQKGCVEHQRRWRGVAW